MWQQPWGYREGLIIGLGLFVTGSVLQLSIGGIDWSLMSFPVNVILGIGLVLVVVAMHLLRGRIHLFRWLSSYQAAVASLLWVGGITVVMGLTKQMPAGHSAVDPLGFSQMIASWPFTLLYLWLVLALCLATVRVGWPKQWRQVPFFLNHAGLIIALVAGVLGNADMQRLKMTCKIGQAEWRATDESGRLVELPLAIELQHFHIDEYPPKLMVISNDSGKTLPEGNPQHLSLEDSLASGKLLEWEIQVTASIPMAGSMVTEDTIRFVDFHSMGGTYAAHIEATNKQTGERQTGWVSAGSFVFPYKPLRLDSLTSLVMPEREPRRYASEVKIYTQEQTITEGTIEVNRPMKVSGWKIYQLSYDEAKGRWSDVSVFELVRDPWLPIVYVGIGMLMLGAIGLFINAQRKKDKEEVL